MSKFLKSMSTVGLCVIASAGCKSQILRSRTASAQRSAPAVAEANSEPVDEVSLGQASYEQFAANPNGSPVGRTPYYFGGSASASSSNSLNGSATSAAAKRC